MSVSRSDVFSTKSGAHGKAADRELQALLQAGEAVITEKGFARSTVEEVAARANVSVEVFHAHFEGIEALLRALSDGFVAMMIAVTDQSTGAGIWKGAAARDVVEVAVRSILDVVIERRGLVRAFLAQGATDPAFAVDLRRAGTHLAKQLITVLGECANVPVRSTRAIGFSLLMAGALAHHYILVGDEWSGVSFSKEQLTEEAARAICAYLGLQPTIAIREEPREAAPTEMVRAITTAEIESVKMPRGKRPKK